MTKVTNVAEMTITIKRPTFIERRIPNLVWNRVHQVGILEMVSSVPVSAIIVMQIHPAKSSLLGNPLAAYAGFRMRCTYKMVPNHIMAVIMWRYPVTNLTMCCAFERGL